MSQPTHVDDQAIARGAQQVVDAIERMRAHINKVTATAEEMKAGWKGDAYNAFVGVADSWKQEGIRLNARLNDISDTLTTVIKKTNASEDQSSGSIGALRM
ncbi:WXG100 family type VII secretion target [Nocardia transvalensis]|uniref:WXG100 family type VII secretion target n=1 Tax=Nocardia transvalensis TaxID=37333 RepID=UPI0018947BF8|nr:WXG100 family type VII secretion target [Nocardia transvalensis]MBF6327479.1 WXG100 family type VII secretion target [Nocardia transvalensis]